MTKSKLHAARISRMVAESEYDHAARLMQTQKAARMLERLSAAKHAELKAENALVRHD